MLTVAFVVAEGFEPMALAAQSAFEYANVALGKRAYDVHFLSEHGGLVRSASRLAIDTEPFGRRVFDTVIVGGGEGIIHAVPEALQAFLRRSYRRSRRTASICSGAYLLAEAGLLDGRRATTHWYYVPDFERLYPNVTLEPDRIFVVDGSVWTSAGMTAGIDLALAMVEMDFGAKIARAVAQKLVVYHRRAGGQSQHSAMLDIEATSDRVQVVLAHARAHLAEALSVESLAEVANLSPRQFSRIFREETGQTPAKAIETLRIEAARVLLETSGLSFDEIAADTGFGDRRRLREAFLRVVGQTPQALRRQSKQAA